MERRTLLFGAASIAAGAATAIGTGAFDSVNAGRTVTLETANDNNAYLRLKPLADDGNAGDPTGRSGTYGTTVWFEIPGDGNGESQSAEGVGPDSVYEFHGLLRIENQGTQPIEIYSAYEGDALADIALVHDGGVLKDDPPVLGVGEQLDVGLYIDSTGAEIGEYDETLTIVAEATDD